MKKTLLIASLGILCIIGCDTTSDDPKTPIPETTEESPKKLGANCLIELGETTLADMFDFSNDSRIISYCLPEEKLLFINPEYTAEIQEILEAELLSEDSWSFNHPAAGPIVVQLKKLEEIDPDQRKAALGQTAVEREAECAGYGAGCINVYNENNKFLYSVDYAKPDYSCTIGKNLCYIQLKAVPGVVYRKPNCTGGKFPVKQYHDWLCAKPPKIVP